MGRIMGSPMAGGRAGEWAASTSLSGAYLQNYSSYGYEISWVDRSHQGGVQCAGIITLASLIFSSPEHNVLSGSYCDQSSSVVRPSIRPSVRPLTISLKIFSSKTRRPILIKLGRNVPWVKLYKNC